MKTLNLFYRVGSMMLLLVLLLYSISSPAGSARADGTITFAEHIVDSDFVDPQYCYATDVDRDGDTDILCPSDYGNTIAWWENDGGQNFTKHVVGWSNRVHTVHATDVDGDGDVDVLGAASVSDEIAWWENDGAQNFTKHVVASAIDAMSAYAEDMDGDGDVDILGADKEGGAITWWENDGNENFTGHTITDALNLAWWVYATDMDGDGDVDVLGTDCWGSAVIWWENDGNENFAGHTIDDAFAGPYTVYAVDVDGDGDVDVLAAATGDDEIAWWENDGAQNFAKHVITNTFDGASSAYAADLDDDGDMDVLGTAMLDGTIAWWENDGTENFTKHTVDSAFPGTLYATAIDIDGDGDLDILGSSYDLNDITWYENSGGPAFPPSGPANSPWPMYQHDAQRTSRSPFVGPDRPYLEWSYPFPTTEGGGSLPSIAPDGTVYFGKSNHLYALSPDGTLKWAYGPTPNVIWSSPAVASDGTIYVGHNGYTNGNLLAIIADGSLKWEYPAREVRSSPAIAEDGTIYVGASDARLYSINPDGSLKWRYRPGFAEAYSSPAIGADGTIYIAGTKERNLHAVNPDGTTKWTYPIGTTGDTESSPTVDSNGTIYVGGSDDKLYAIDPSGTLKWSYYVGDVHTAAQSAAIGPDGTVYIVSDEGILYAFTPAGDLKWTYTSDAGWVRTVPTVDANGTVYFSGEFNGKIYAINPDGSEKWTFQTPASGLGPVIIKSNGTLYVHGREEFYAIGEMPNTPPTAYAGEPYSANEGDTVILDASGSSDPDENIVLYEWDLDNDGEYDDATGVTTEIAFDDNGVFTVGLRVTDECSGSDTDTAEVTVLNVAPTVDAGASATINEGDTFSGSGSFADPSADTWEAIVDYGDGSGSQPLALTGNTFALSHTYADNGVYTVEICVTDDDNGTGCDTLTVTVLNVAPTVGAITAPVDPVQVNMEISVSTDFTDPGVLDTHMAVWDWGDDTTSPGTVNETGGSGSVTGSHTYTAAGVYTVKLTMTDKDGDSGQSVFQYAVVYDPEGGFVTGGGWIDSPAEAYAPDPSLAGKATFGFVAKYKKGAATPTGETEFRFRVAHLNFHSDTYQWLVVAGSKAQFKGTGTINGAGNYGFMLTALDAELTPSAEVDKFRIKIWDKDNGDTIVYDNQMEADDDVDPATAIGGGSIVIHKAK